MKKQPDLSLLDKRVAKRLIERGLLKEEDYKNFLENLPDKQNDAERIQVEFTGKKDHGNA